MHDRGACPTSQDFPLTSFFDNLNKPPVEQQPDSTETIDVLVIATIDIPVGGLEVLVKTLTPFVSGLENGPEQRIAGLSSNAPCFSPSC